MSTRTGLLHVLSACLLLGLVAPAARTQVAPVLELHDDSSASGYGGTPVRAVEVEMPLRVTIRGPVGYPVYLLAGLKREPGIPMTILGSPNPLLLDSPIGDLTRRIHHGTQPVTYSERIHPQNGVYEGGFLLGANLAGIRLAFQALLIDPGTLRLLLTNAIEVELVGGPAGPPASVEARLSSLSVEEEDEGGVLTLGAVVRDARGRVVRPTPALHFTTDAPGARFTSPTTVVFPSEGVYDVTAHVIGTGLSHTVPVRVAPEMIRSAYLRAGSAVNAALDVADSAIEALGRSDLGALPGLVAGLRAARDGLPVTQGRDALAPIGCPYPALVELINSGFFPALRDDPELLTLIQELITTAQELRDFATAVRYAQQAHADLSELRARHDDLRRKVLNLRGKQISSRAIYQHLQPIQRLLGEMLMGALREQLTNACDAFEDAVNAVNKGKAIVTAILNVNLAKLAWEIYQPYLKYLGDCAAQMAVHNLLTYYLAGAGGPTIDCVWTINHALGPSGVFNGGTVQIEGYGFHQLACKHRIVVIAAHVSDPRVQTAQQGFAGHDTVCDYFQAAENLQVAVGNRFFMFEPDFRGTDLLCTGAYTDMLRVNSWPLQSTSNLPFPISVMVLRIDQPNGLSAPILTQQYRNNS